MRKFKLSILCLALCFSFSSCEKEEAYTDNPFYIPEATGDNAKELEKGQSGNGGGSGGGSANQLPADFMAPINKLNRAALLEDFTGVRCQFCPDGHDVAKTLKTQLGNDRFIVLAVHGGSYATPANGWANFTTPFGQALIDQALVSGYPAGTMSRIEADELGVTPQQTSGYAMGRGSWSSAANKVVTMESPVNIGAKASIDANRELTVDVDLYYTASETGANNINVALVQDGLKSSQSIFRNGGAEIDTAYLQNNVLRYLLTSQWGVEVPIAKDSSGYHRQSFTYSVPQDYNGTGTNGGGAVVLSDLRVVVFVTRGRTEVLNAIEVDVQ
jgi:hypothetical protein